MPGKTILILGGGWGGLSAAHALRGLLKDDHRVVVIEKNERFSFYPANLWIMTGERAYTDGAEREMRHLAHRGIEWVHADVRRIDPEARRVETTAGSLQGDYLVLALGAELAPEGIPGFAAAYSLYDALQAAELRTALDRFEAGEIVVLITRVPFRCPAAPYEAAFLLEWLARQRGIRDRVRIALYTPEKLPMPVAGPAVGGALRAMLAEHGIDYHPEHVVSRVDRAARRIVFEGNEASYDLLVGVPPHRAPRVVVDAGLIDGTGYVPTHPQTLELLSDPDTLTTRFPGVYAIGDVTAIRLLNGMLLPKAGVFADGEARVVAQAIAADIAGRPAPEAFNGRGVCYVEVGNEQAAFGSGNFYAYPAPSVMLDSPSRQYRQDKLELGRMLDTWFTPAPVRAAP
jgi:sulfide:quinone oxidoreductase